MKAFAEIDINQTLTLVNIRIFVQIDKYLLFFKVQK